MKDKDIKGLKKPWPTKEAMKQIYEMKLWGGENFDFYSGVGSHNPEIVKPYLKAVTTFLSSFQNKPIICDLGCGDFNIGKELVNYTKNYHAVDIVDNLIARNAKKFKVDHLEFHCLDIAVDDLPSGDCVLLRQVLQHLSNNEIQKIVNKLVDFKYIIITEHIPIGKFTANKDIISGQGIRLKKQSGVILTASPFGLKVKEEKQLSSVTLNGHQGKIVTTLYKT
ncbi:class I SAM-dependent methyltransferase [Psychroflexus aestuariivivens]|uniref:class I SAM-dependent methyltransferase n=1 Tax=Psychroflexus aestuariivivens TaxID=1795040 RepID=UPI000FD6BDE5|nr:class I SAM-dependent methyltransferase [Psychroflexus aestuariivivens]